VSFTLHEGVLYDKTMYTLLYYPASKTDETFTLPEKTKEIAGGAFSSSKLKKVVLHDDITVIPESAFENCALLEEVVMGDVTAIGNAAFKNCASLTTITVPASVKTIGDYAFAGCTALTNEGFKIASGSQLTTYGSHLFEGCTSITAPFDYFKTFTDYMYANTGITTLVFGNQELSAKGVFANCTKLTSVSWAEKAMTSGIGDAFFYGCTALETVVLPEGLSQLGSYANDLSQIEREGALGVFTGCTALKSVTLPSTLEYIGACVFENCASLTTVNYNEGGRGFMVYARAFKGCTALNDTSIFSYFMYIGDEAFMNCVALAGEIKIAEGKFDTIGSNAFNGCTQITAFYLPSRFGMISKTAFAGMNENVIFYISMNPKDFEGNFSRDNPFEGYQIVFVEGSGKEEEKKEEEKK